MSATAAQAMSVGRHGMRSPTMRCDGVPVLVRQITEWVDCAHEPVVVPVPVVSERSRSGECMGLRFIASLP